MAPSAVRPGRRLVTSLASMAHPRRRSHRVVIMHDLDQF
jgi:hypothetical protein